PARRRHCGRHPRRRARAPDGRGVQAAPRGGGGTHPRSAAGGAAAAVRTGGAGRRRERGAGGPGGAAGDRPAAGPGAARGPRGGAPPARRPSVGVLFIPRASTSNGPRMRSRLHRSIAVAVLLAPLALWARPAGKPVDPTAKVHYDAGAAYYVAGKFEDAVREF